jgi:hypothetical protein
MVPTIYLNLFIVAEGVKTKKKVDLKAKKMSKFQLFLKQIITPGLRP